MINHNLPPSSPPISKLLFILSAVHFQMLAAFLLPCLGFGTRSGHFVLPRRIFHFTSYPSNRPCIHIRRSDTVFIWTPNVFFACCFPTNSACPMFDVTRPPFAEDAELKKKRQICFSWSSRLPSPLPPSSPYAFLLYHSFILSSIFYIHT